MKPLRFIVYIVILFVSFDSIGQNFSQLNYSSHFSEPDQVIVAVSPAGHIFRAETLDITSQFGNDTFRIYRFDAMGIPFDSCDIGGYVLRCAMEADDDQVYLNIQFYNVQIYQITLPGIGTIETNNFVGGSLVVAMNENLEVSWYEFFGASNLTGFWDCDMLITQTGNIMFNVADDHPDFSLYLEIKEYTPEGTFVRELFQTELIYTIEEDSQGNIYATGPCAQLDANFNGEEITLTFDYNFYVVKYDADLNYEWSNYVEEITCSFVDLAVSSNDEVFIGLSMIFGTYYFDDIMVEISQNLHYVIAKLNDDGHFVWVTKISEGSESMGGATVTYNNDFLTGDNQGNLYLCGNAQGELSWNNGQQFMDYQAKPFVARILDNGQIEWIKLASEGTNNVYGNRIEWSDMGFLVLCGTGTGPMYLDSLQINEEGSYAYHAKLDVENPVTLVQEIPESNLTVYPNPFKDKLSLGFTGLENNELNLSISDIYGNILIKIDPCLKDQLEIDVHSLPHGVYFINLYSDQVKYTRKAIKIL